MQLNNHQIEINEIVEGFLNSYQKIDTGLLKVFEASTQINALIELLIAKGIIGIEELDERKRIVEKRLSESYEKAGLGVKIQPPGTDKYKFSGEVKIDCHSRIPFCRAACCRLNYALTPQDIDERIRWNLGNPFINAKRADGYCVHLASEGLTCTVYEQRPIICQAYDCRDDNRIWADFEKMVPSPDLLAPASGSLREKTPG